MSVQNGQTEKGHQVMLSMRKELKIFGVKEVESFDETGAVLHTLCGEMTVEGKDIRIGVLDVERGEVTLSGRIDGLFYPSDEVGEKRGFFKKLTR